MGPADPNPPRRAPACLVEPRPPAPRPGRPVHRSKSTSDLKHANLYRRGQPQNPISHSGSMVFSEHGRLALLNPFVLMKMFGIQGRDRSLPITKAQSGHVPHFIKPNCAASLKREFAYVANQVHPLTQIVRVAYNIAKLIYHIHQRTINKDVDLDSLLTTSRHGLQKIFLCTEKMKNRASVPNVHLALHYRQDIALFGTPKNVLAAEGEQMHAAPKRHASHTNNKERILQLESAVNHVQTMRHVADGAFPSHAFTAQFNRVVDACPILKERFLGASSGSNSEEPQTDRIIRDLNNDDVCGDDVDIVGSISNAAVDCSGSGFKHMKVGTPLKRVLATTKAENIPLILDACEREYHLTIFPGMSYRIHFWQRITAQHDDSNHTRTISLRIGSFVRYLPLDQSTPQPSIPFFRIARIVTLTLGTQRRCFLVCSVLDRAFDEEWSEAPYEVYKEVLEKVCFSVRSVAPENLHFVSKTPTSWWWNPYIVNFT
jgi:hypothetical protein